MKKNLFLKSGMAIMVSLGINVSAQAADPVAEPDRINNTVIVYQNGDATSARNGMPLKPGDRVTTLDNSSAVVDYYGNACGSVSLQPNQQHTVDDPNKECVGAVVSVGQTAAIGGAAAAARTTAAAGFGFAGAAVTAIGVGGVAAAAKGNSGGGNALSAVPITFP